MAAKPSTDWKTDTRTKSGLSTTVRLYWIDQFSNGFDGVRPGGFVPSPDVTGRLDDELRALGGNTTSIWRLDPGKAARVP